MRVAVVVIPQSKRDKLLEVAKALGSGIEAQGHRVEIIDGSDDLGSKLTIYEYVAIGTEVTSLFGGKVPAHLSAFLKNAGAISGKRAFAFVLKKSIGADKGLQRLMKQMESEGLYLKYSEVLSSPTQATEIGKRLNIN